MTAGSLRGYECAGPFTRLGYHRKRPVELKLDLQPAPCRSGFIPTGRGDPNHRVELKLDLQPAPL